jgi:L-threonylcarbamoyladenylate synthase
MEGARVIRAGGGPDFPRAVAHAAEIVVAGGLVACPTESFYGLAVSAVDERAIERLFRVKARPARNPVLLLISGRGQLASLVDHIPPLAARLMDAFWPGALTLVLQASPRVSPLLTAGEGKIGVRLSSHPLPTTLAASVGCPITGTSANLSGQAPCRSAGEVSRAFGDQVDLILDGGVTAGSVGSTVLDVTADPPRVLRQGLISPEQLREVVGA